MLPCNVLRLNHLNSYNHFHSLDYIDPNENDMRSARSRFSIFEFSGRYRISVFGLRSVKNPKSSSITEISPLGSACHRRIEIL